MKLLAAMRSQQLAISPSANCSPRPEIDDCSSRYHWELEKNHCGDMRAKYIRWAEILTDRILLPIVEPMDRASKNMNKNTM